MTSIKFCHVTQNIWQMWSCEQSLVNLVFLWEKLSKIQFYMDLAGKNDFWRGCHCLKIIHQRCKRVKIKSQKYSFHLMEKLLRKKSDWVVFFSPPSWIRLTLLLHCCKNSRPYLVPIPSYWTWNKSTTEKDQVFWANPYKIEVMITSLTLIWVAGG